MYIASKQNYYYYYYYNRFTAKVKITETK